jgi:hypothetical protein
MSIANVAQEYMAKLFGSPAVAYNVQPSQWVGLQPPAQQPAQPGQQQPVWGDRDGGEDRGSQGGPWADRGGIPTVNSPDYWAGQFKPDIGWRDVLKAYGPSIAGALTGNPLMVGLNMARMYKNPTQDPLWQKAASQYLDAIGNPMSLTDVIRQINDLYKANIDSRIFASDTARGVLLGLGNPTQWGQASRYGMAPHQFAQAMSGYNYAGIDPTSPNTFEMFSGPTYDSLRDVYGYSNQPQSSFLADYARMIGTGEVSRNGPVAQAHARGLEAAAARDLSNRWMSDVLNGYTTEDFSTWKDHMEHGYDRENDRDGDGWGDQDVSGSDRVKDNYE